MKRRSLLVPFLFALMFAFPVTGQTAAGDMHQFGSVTVQIPSPEGFFNAFARSARFKEKYVARQKPPITVLAIFAPDAIAADLEKDPDIFMPTYAKAAVDVSSRAVNIGPAQYKEFVTGLEQQFSESFDPNGPVMQAAKARLKKIAAQENRADRDFTIKGPQSIGFFQKESNVFSGMLLMTVEAEGRSATVIGAFSVVYVKNRLVYANLFRAFNDEKDPETARDLAKKWTAAIIAANK